MIHTYEVREVERRDASHLVLNVHYARRWPSVSYVFGLFDRGFLAGVCCFGTPAGSTQRTGLLGADMAPRVLELNRLCLTANLPNEASFLVSRSLRLLPQPTAVLSYADTSQGHTGVVYQATNALYLGLTEKRTDWALKSRPGVHGQTIADEFSGKGRAQKMREKYGDDFYLKPRPRKHRYVWFLGSKGDRAAMRKALKYPCLPYPKKTDTQDHGPCSLTFG